MIDANRRIKTEKIYEYCKLKTIVIKTTELLKTKKVGTNAFKGIPDNAVFTCPKGKAKAYRTLLLKKGAPSKATFR